MPIPGYVNEDESTMVLCGACMAFTLVFTGLFPEAVARWTTPQSEWDSYRDDIVSSNKRFRARKRRLREEEACGEEEDDHPWDPLEVELKRGGRAKETATRRRNPRSKKDSKDSKNDR